MLQLSEFCSKLKEHNFLFFFYFYKRNKRDDNGNYEEQHWDIRNNIPGEPDIDYPIYGNAPETNFVCKDRHDGKLNINFLNIDHETHININ